MTENSRHNAGVSEDTQPTDAPPIEEALPDPNEAAEPIEVHNSFATDPTRQESWLNYLKTNGRNEEADKLEAELNTNKVV